VKILDFGIALMMDGAGEVGSDMMTRQITEPGMALGTVGYMSPEQVRGERVDQRSDIFALGVVLYEMLSGRRPFSRGSKIETLNAILTETPTDLAGTNSVVPPALDRVVRHCLDKDPAMRFQSARDVAFALESAAMQSGPLQAAANTHARTSTSGRRLAFIAGAGLVVCLRQHWERCTRAAVRPRRQTSASRFRRPPTGPCRAFSACRPSFRLTGR
jgi:serine/threonine protein kinase